VDRGNSQEHVALQAAFREITEVSLVEETSRGLAKSASALGLPPDPSLIGASLSPERSRFAGAGQASAAQLDLPTSFIPPLFHRCTTLCRDWLRTHQINRSPTVTICMNTLSST